MATLQEQMAINSAMWFNASPQGKIYLHDENVKLQAQIDKANQTVTVYKPSTGTYQTQAAVPVQTVVDKPSTPTVTNYPVQTTAASNSAVSQTTAQTAIQKRTAEAQAFTGWDNDPTLRGMQVRSWDLYIASGSWTSPEQVKLHNDAEALRKSMNVTYGGAIWGTPNKGAADSLILPDNQPNVTGVSGAITGAIKGLVTNLAGTSSDGSGGLLPLVLGGGAILMLMSVFKER